MAETTQVDGSGGIAEVAPKHLKNVLKSLVEILASIPSVVLGFIAGLWLAPVLERYVPGLLVMPVVVVVLSVGGAQGTLIGTTAMRGLPVGVPKVMLSTMASGVG